MKYRVTVTSEKFSGSVVFELEAQYFYTAIESVKALIVKGNTIISPKIRLSDLILQARRA